MCSSGTFLSYIKGVKYFHISRGNMGFLSKDCSGKVPHLTLSGESRGFSRVAAGSLVFLSSGDGYLGDLPELYQGCQVPFRVSRGNMVFLSRHCSGKGPHLALNENLVVFLELQQKLRVHHEL